MGLAIGKTAVLFCEVRPKVILDVPLPVSGELKQNLICWRSSEAERRTWVESSKKDAQMGNVSSNLAFITIMRRSRFQNSPSAPHLKNNKQRQVQQNAI